MTIKYRFQPMSPMEMEMLYPQLATEGKTAVLELIKNLPSVGGAQYKSEPVAVFDSWEEARDYADRLNNQHYNLPGSPG